jgi:hypothetical protein
VGLQVIMEWGSINLGRCGNRLVRSGRFLGEPGRDLGGDTGRSLLWREGESARRLQRVLLLRLCQGAENPEEAIGILGGGGG